MDLPPVQGKKGFPAQASRAGWIDLEDEVLRRAHQKHGGEGKGKWATMSEYFKRWDNEECWQRWKQSINPYIKHQPWTKEEDKKVSISHFSVSSSPSLTLISLAKINDHVKQHGATKWAALAATLPGRTGDQCRFRWTRTLDTTIKRGCWSASEDKILIEAHKKLGNKWAKISKLIDGRTGDQCRKRWRQDALQEKLRHHK